MITAAMAATLRSISHKYALLQPDSSATFVEFVEPVSTVVSACVLSEETLAVSLDVSGGVG